MVFSYTILCSMEVVLFTKQCFQVLLIWNMTKILKVTYIYFRELLLWLYIIFRFWPIVSINHWKWQFSKYGTYTKLATLRVSYLDLEGICEGWNQPQRSLLKSHRAPSGISSKKGGRKHYYINQKWLSFLKSCFSCLLVHTCRNLFFFSCEGGLIFNSLVRHVYNVCLTTNN